MFSASHSIIVHLPKQRMRTRRRSQLVARVQILLRFNFGAIGFVSIASVGALVEASITLVGLPFASRSIFLNRRSSSSANDCSETTAVTASLGLSKGTAAIAALILTDNGICGLR
jgi:hypothetical protein